MRVFNGATFVALVFLSACCVPFSASAQSAVAQTWNQAVAEQALGSQWQQMSRRAGMIFTGTVLATDARSENSNLVNRSTWGSIAPDSMTAFRVTFHVDRAIAGVKAGEVLTIREWAGALSAQRPMRVGERLLLFLYAPSLLGFTSPVGGTRGQIVLDGRGRFIPSEPERPVTVPQSPPGPRPITVVPPFIHSSAITVDQLERAIHSARGE